MRDMSREAKMNTKSLREVWSVHILIGRWSFFVGVGEVRVCCNCGKATKLLPQGICRDCLDVITRRV